MNVLIVGPMPLSASQTAVATSREWDYVVAVDGGMVQCAELGVSISILVGDLDSIPEGMDLAHCGCSIDEHPVEKDYSDLDAAADHLRTLEFDSVTAVGLTGGRLDHQLGVLGSLVRLRQSYGDLECSVTLHGDDESTRFLMPGDCAEVVPGRTFSVVPLIGTAVVSIWGARWNLESATVEPLSSHGLSNESSADGARILVSGNVPVLLIVQYA